MRVGEFKERILRKLGEKVDILAKAREVVEAINGEFVYVKDVWDACIKDVGDSEKCARIVGEVVKTMFVGKLVGVSSGSYDRSLFRVLESVLDMVGVEVGGEADYEWGLGEGLERLLVNAMYELGLENGVEPIEWLERCLNTFPREKCVDAFVRYVNSFEIRNGNGKN